MSSSSISFIISTRVLYDSSDENIAEMLERFTLVFIALFFMFVINTIFSFSSSINFNLRVFNSLFSLI